MIFINHSHQSETFNLNILKKKFITGDRYYHISYKTLQMPLLLAEPLRNKEMPVSEVFTEASPLDCLLRALSKTFQVPSTV